MLNIPGIYLNEVQQKLLDITGCKWLIRCSEVLRAKYIAEMEAFDPELLFLDETSCEGHNLIQQFIV